MKKIIKGKTYKTDTAVKLANRTFGSFGDPAGYEETLYQTKKGLYFVHGIGGETSPYPQPSIRPVTGEEAETFEK